MKRFWLPRIALLLILCPIFVVAYFVAAFSRGDFRFRTNSSASILHLDQVDLYSDEVCQPDSGWSHLLNLNNGSSLTFPASKIILGDDDRVFEVLGKYLALVDCPIDRQTLLAPTRVSLIDRVSLKTYKVLDLPGRPELWHEGRVLCTSDNFENSEYDLNTWIVDIQSPTKFYWEMPANETLVALENGYFLSQQPITRGSVSAKSFTVTLRHMSNPEKSIVVWQMNGTRPPFPVLKCSDQFILILSPDEPQTAREGPFANTRTLKLDIRELTTGALISTHFLPPEINESNYDWCSYFPKHNRMLFSFSYSAFIYDIAERNKVLTLDEVQTTNPKWHSDNFVCLRHARDMSRHRAGIREERFIQFLDIRTGDLSRKFPEDGRFQFLASDNVLVTVEKNGQVKLSEVSSGKTLKVYRDHSLENYFRFALVISLIAWEIAWINLGFRQHYHSLPTIACAFLAVFIPVWMRVKFAGAESDPKVISNALLTGLLTGLLVLTWTKLWFSKERFSLRLLTFTCAIYLSSEVIVQRGLPNTVRFHSTCITLLLITIPFFVLHSWLRGKKREPGNSAFGTRFRTLDMLALITSIAICLVTCMAYRSIVECYLTVPVFQPIKMFLQFGGREGCISGIFIAIFTLVILWSGRGRSPVILRLCLGLAAFFVTSYCLLYSVGVIYRARPEYYYLWMIVHAATILTLSAMLQVRNKTVLLNSES